MPPKSKKSKKDDDDDALLEEQAKIAAAAAESLAKSKAAEERKKQLVAQENLAKQQALLKAAALLPPIRVNNVAEDVAAFIKHKNPNMRDACWGTYILNRFMMLAVEKHRRISLVVPTAESTTQEEEIIRFEVHDDKHPDDSHAWNVIVTSSGAYAIDVSLEQFLPLGRYGYRRDDRPENGWEPVKAPSRLYTASAARAEAAATEPLVGVPAIDSGIVAEGGSVDVALGVPAGSYDSYIKFIVAANDGRHKKMSADERAVAEILQRNKAVPMWLELHKQLESKYLSA